MNTTRGSGAAPPSFAQDQLGPDAPNPAVAGADDHVRICIDADCPSCGWPERWAILPKTRIEPGPLFGCPKCDYTSEYRDV